MSSGSKVSDSYAVRDGDILLDEEDILRLWLHLPGHRPPQLEKLDWFYRNNPAGQGAVLFLYYIPEDRPVGVVCLGPRKIFVDGEERSGAVFGDFAIEPNHRSLGPALLFQREFLRVAKARYDVIYGFPNDLSGRVRAFGGYKLEHQLSICVLPVDYRYYFARHLPKPVANVFGWIANRVARFRIRLTTAGLRRRYRPAAFTPEFVNGLWDRMGDRRDGLGIRDADFLAWRLQQSPYRDFEYMALENLGGKPCSLIAFSRASDGAVDIIDHMSRDDDALVAVVSQLVLNDDAISPSISISLSPDDTDTVRRLAAIGFSERSRTQYFVSTEACSEPAIDKRRIKLNICDNDA